MNLWVKHSLLIGLILVATSCNRFGTDNQPQPTALRPFTPLTTVTKLWSTKVGRATEQNDLRLVLALQQNRLITTDALGTITATDIKQGKLLWRNALKTHISSGVGVGEGLAAVVSANAVLYTVELETGKVLWKAHLVNQALAVPTLAQGLVLVKTIDDQVFAFDAKTGKQRWAFATDTPQLILRFGSSPILADNKVIIGLANGKMFVVNSLDGTILSEQTIATPQGSTEAQQMVDIDVNPIVDQGTVYVAAYQGKLKAIALTTATVLWQQTVSSYTGMVIDHDDLVITDADSRVWSFQKNKGVVQWQQIKLAYRHITAPALSSSYVVVGDAQGYMHLLSRQTGELAARWQVTKDAILAAPVVQDNLIYVLNSRGILAAYKIG